MSPISESSSQSSSGTPSGAILAAARVLFAKNGFNATTTRSIAEEAGVNLALIHYYFGNKEQLYRKVVELEFEDLFRLVGEAVKGGRPPREFLPTMPGLVMGVHAGHPELRRIMMREMIDGAPRLATLLKDLGDRGPRGLRTRLAEYVGSVGPDTFAPPVPPTHLLALIFAMGHGLIAFAPLLAEVFDLDLGDPATAEALAESAGTVVRRALAPSKEA